MTENSYLIEVVMRHGAIVRLTYASREEADAALAAVEPKIGGRFRNDPDVRKHRFDDAAGGMVVDMDDVMAVRVLDGAAWDAGTAFMREREEQQARRMADAMAQAMKAAGLGVPLLPAAT